MASLALGALGGLLALGGERINKHGGLLRTAPTANSAIHYQDDLLNALDNYVKRTSPDNPIDEFNLSVATAEDIAEASKPRGDLRRVASSGIENGNPLVKINMNAPASMFAHELGHVAFGQTGIGSTVKNARSALKKNPKLRNSILAASVLAPGAAAALTPGDDDLATSVALSIALDSPALIDEFEANRRSLALMKDAGVPITRGDRARMAGSFLSYLGKPLVLAASGNLAGNFIDQDLPAG